MAITDELNALFERWQEEFPEHRGKLVKDGVINEKLYLLQNPKVLFIAKEPNDPGQSGGDFREWWSKEVKYSFSHRISEWAFGLFNGFPQLDVLPDGNVKRVEIFQSIAFMNLKKTGGSATTRISELEAVVSKERQLIQDEIDIINPQIIIGGIGNQSLWSIIFPGIEFIKTGFDISVAKHKSIKIIDYYHPSYRVPRAMSYCLLGRVYQSDVFQKLGST